MFDQCWPTVYDNGPTLVKHWVDVLSANMTHQLNVWPMLAHRLRRWPNIGQTLGRCVVFGIVWSCLFSGIIHCFFMTRDLRWWSAVCSVWSLWSLYTNTHQIHVDPGIRDRAGPDTRNKRQHCSAKPKGSICLFVKYTDSAFWLWKADLHISQQLLAYDWRMLVDPVTSDWKVCAISFIQDCVSLCFNRNPFCSFICIFGKFSGFLNGTHLFPHYASKLHFHDVWCFEYYYSRHDTLSTYAVTLW